MDLTGSDPHVLPLRSSRSNVPAVDTTVLQFAAAGLHGRDGAEEWSPAPGPPRVHADATGAEPVDERTAPAHLVVVPPQRRLLLTCRPGTAGTGIGEAEPARSPVMGQPGVPWRRPGVSDLLVTSLAVVALYVLLVVVAVLIGSVLV